MAKTFLNIQEANKEIAKLRKQLCCCRQAVCTSATYTDATVLPDVGELIETGWILSVVIVYNGTNIITESIMGDGLVTVGDFINTINGNWAGFAMVFSLVNNTLQLDVSNSNIACELTYSVSYFAD